MRSSDTHEVLLVAVAGLVFITDFFRSKYWQNCRANHTGWRLVDILVLVSIENTSGTDLVGCPPSNGNKQASTDNLHHAVKIAHVDGSSFTATGVTYQRSVLHW